MEKRRFLTQFREALVSISWSRAKTIEHICILVCTLLLSFNISRSMPRGFKPLSRIVNRALEHRQTFMFQPSSPLLARRDDMVKLHSFLPLIFLLAVSGQLDADSNVYGASILTNVLLSVGFKAETISKILVSSLLD